MNNPVNLPADFFKCDVIGSLSPLARLLWVGLWTISDRNRTVEYRPKRIRAMVLPYDQCDAVPLLEELQHASLIDVFMGDDAEYLTLMTPPGWTAFIPREFLDWEANESGNVSERAGA